MMVLDYAGSKHIMCWGLEDTFVTQEKNQSNSDGELLNPIRGVNMNFVYILSGIP